MTKGIGQKHFQRDDHKHAAHQQDFARRQDQPKPDKRTETGPAGHEPYPADETPTSPRKGQ